MPDVGPRGTRGTRDVRCDVRSELGEARWRGYEATLLALAEAGGGAGQPGGADLARARSREAADVLRAVDDLLCDEVVEGQLRVWREVGLALHELGYGRLWPALYDLCDLARDEAATPDDAAAFLEREDLPVRPRPDGWPAPWLEGHAPDPPRIGDRGGRF